MSIPLIDSLAHPTLTGTWLGKPAEATFEQLIHGMAAANYRHACAIGMWGQDGYEPEQFIRQVQRFPQLYPVAGYRPETTESIATELDALKEMGYRGIKLHARFSRLNVFDPIMGEILREASRRDLVVFYCTYMHTSLDQWPVGDPFLALIEMLKAAPEARVILVHGGDVELLRYMQLVRFNANLLLDLSMTIAKYPGSSLDADIGFLFREFDRRICLGTDWPQHSHAEVRTRFEHFGQGVASEKLHNIAHRNLLSFLGIEAL